VRGCGTHDAVRLPRISPLRDYEMIVAMRARHGLAALACLVGLAILIGPSLTSASAPAPPAPMTAECVHLAGRALQARNVLAGDPASPATVLLVTDTYGGRTLIEQIAKDGATSPVLTIPNSMPLSFDPSGTHLTTSSATTLQRSAKRRSPADEKRAASGATRTLISAPSPGNRPGNPSALSA
jgi:hypothetical protein